MPEEKVKEERNRTSANGEGSCKYIESKKLWCARITIGWDGIGENRKQIRKAFYGKSKKEALNKATEAQARVLHGEAATSSNMKLSDWADKWMADYKSALAPRTIAQYKGVVKNQIKPAIGDYALKNLKQSQIQKMVNDLFEKGYSPTIIKHTKQFTHEMLEAAVDDGYLVANPARKIRLPNMPKTKNEKGAFTPYEEEQLIAFMPHYLTQEKPHVPHKVGKAIIVSLKSGVRQEELLALSWDDINFTDSTISIHQSVTLNGYTPIIVPRTKNESSIRKIPLHPKAKEILLEMEPNADKAAPVFCNDSGGIWAPNCFYRLYKSYIDALNIQLEKEGKLSVKYRPPHAMRHTCASDLNRKGTDPKTISQILGHATTDMTMNIYTHTDMQAMKDAMNKI